MATCWYNGANLASRAATAASRSADAGCASNLPNSASVRAMTFFWSGLRNFTSQIPGGSRIPPRLSGSAYISMKSLLIVGSTTTQAPPLSSAFGRDVDEDGHVVLRQFIDDLRAEL